MSRGSSPSIGGTLAGGIQDVSALLPIIGTEQCELHVGSALDGGYLYAAATPLSIFGSLGVVKAGLSVLFTSISISVPTMSFSLSQSKVTIKHSQRDKWLGARIFSDAGFKLSGGVAPLIGMDGQRFKAETRLLEILKEKHVDDAEKISIHWKSRQWNIMLVLTTLFAGALSTTPYIALLLGPASWQPKTHLPWLYPALRIVGSCFAVVACQFIVQSRVVSLMKNRIIFMVLDQEIAKSNKAESEAWMKEKNVQWDPDLPAEQCIWSFEKGLSSFQLDEDPAKQPSHISISMDTPPSLGAHPPAPSVNQPPKTKTLSFKIDSIRQKHFPESTRDTTFTFLSWIILGLSLPATVAGYIGCFTLVSSTPSPGNGPLIWVGLEAALAILRIVVWASNPSFDEDTEITVAVELSKHRPMVTSDEYNPYITKFNHEERKPFTLIPDREFFERITPFTGPLDQFPKADNITIYFTLTTNYGNSDISRFEVKEADEVLKSESQSLFMTVFDLNMRVGVTFFYSKSSFNFFDVNVNYNAITRKLEANMLSDGRDTHPWGAQDNNLFDTLKQYYQYLIGVLSPDGCNSIDTQMGKYPSLNLCLATNEAPIAWKWDLSPKSELTKDPHRKNMTQITMLSSLTDEDRAYLDCGYEHHLKTSLVATWTRWIVMDMQMLRSYARNDCHEGLNDATSEKAKWEYTELDVQLEWEWAKRESALVRLSLALEDILYTKMKKCVSVIGTKRNDSRLMIWMGSEFRSGQQKRLIQERRGARERMERAMKDASEQADREGRPWQADSNQSFCPQWIEFIDVIEQLWSTGINHLWEESQETARDTSAEEQLQSMIGAIEQRRRDDHSDRDSFVEKLRNQVSQVNWRSQHETEEKIMLECIRNVAELNNNSRKELYRTYRYPEPDRFCTAKFAHLLYSSPEALAAYPAVVYDAFLCGNVATVCTAIAKSTTRSVVGVPREVLSSISQNSHLLFLSCRHGDGKEPTFVQENRERWWQEQTTNASVFYFTPQGVIDGGSCFVHSGCIAHLLIFLTVTSTVRVRVLHCGVNATGLSIQEDGEELAGTSHIRSTKFELHEMRSFVLQQGRHKLELIAQVDKVEYDLYFLRDILIDIF